MDHPPLSPNTGLGASNILGIVITDTMRQKLYTIATWSKITAIAGFVTFAISIITEGYVMLKYFDLLSFRTIGNLVSLAISFFVNYLLIQFSIKLKVALDYNDQEMLPIAVARLKDYMRMWGILLIVSVVIIILTYMYVFTRF